MDGGGKGDEADLVTFGVLAEGSSRRDQMLARYCHRPAAASPETGFQTGSGETKSHDFYRRFLKSDRLVEWKEDETDQKTRGAATSPSEALSRRCDLDRPGRA